MNGAGNFRCYRILTQLPSRKDYLHFDMSEKKIRLGRKTAEMDTPPLRMMESLCNCYAMERSLRRGRTKETNTSPSVNNLALGIFIRNKGASALAKPGTRAAYINQRKEYLRGPRKKLRDGFTSVACTTEVENGADKFRRLARGLYDEGADGLMMFNYFSSRGRDEEPDFALFKELSDPEQLMSAAP